MVSTAANPLKVKAELMDVEEQGGDYSDSEVFIEGEFNSGNPVLRGGDHNLINQDNVQANTTRPMDLNANRG